MTFMDGGLSMPVEQGEWDYEEKRLRRVMAEIQRQLRGAEQTTQQRQENLLAARKLMWEESPHGAFDFDDALEILQQGKVLSQVERDYAFYQRLQRRLASMASSPYFGRIDFKEGREAPQPIYVGISSLIEEATETHLVYDWRAPISSLFYDGEPGPAAYLCEAGRIEGEITLKRQYRIVNGRLEYLFDTGLTIEDEVLQEILGKHADNKMRHIVTSIQRDQNRVIRDEAHRLLIVQGPAGSGKTSIALHRAAYLLYRYQKEMRSENIVIFSPNPLFNDYIASVLPQLGEENVLQTTFGEYVARTLHPSVTAESLAEQMEYLFARRGAPGYEARAAAIRYKASSDFLRVIQNYVRYLESGSAVPFADFAHGGDVIIGRDELVRLFGEYAYLPYLKRIEKLKRRILFLLEPIVAERLRRIAEELAARPENREANDIRRQSRALVRDEFQPLKDRIAAWAAADVYELYAELFRNQRLFGELAAGTPVPAEAETIRRHTRERLASGRIGYEDVAPLLYFKGGVEGVAATKGIKHVFIDEAQDYSPFHYAIFKHLFPQSAFTILGDLNQSIHPYSNVRSYETILGVFGDASGALIQLRHSYRSTREIVAFASAVLAGGEPIETIDRHGEKPRVIQLGSDAERAEAMGSDIAELRAGGAASVAVICKTAAESARAYELLRRCRVSVSLVGQDDTKFQGGSVVIPSYLAKGLEFDAVLIYDASSERYGHETERRLLYTACTRALHWLHVYYEERLSPFIAAVPAELYQQGKAEPPPKGRGN